jgi:hypothetical protein
MGAGHSTEAELEAADAADAASGAADALPDELQHVEGILAAAAGC